ncbi:MAG: ribonuclease R [Bacteroidales bacterium]|nr:ribonuclease R [Bacteroidales bacterium]
MNSIVNLLSLEPNKTFNYKQIAHALQMKNGRQKEAVAEVLFELEMHGIVSEPDFGVYRINTRQAYITGRIDKQRTDKKTYLIPDDGAAPVLIPERATNRAMNGDIVKVLLTPHRKGHEQEGEVVEVIKRARTEFVGTLEIKHNFAFVSVDRKLLQHDIFVPTDKTKGGKNGQKCVVRITEWDNTDKNPIGEVIDVLGNIGDNNTEMHAILAEFGLPYSYPKEVEEAANHIPEEIPQEEIDRRIDMRDVTTFTIDPRDAKDFDDALSIRQLGENEWEVGVHIADVTYYVTPGSIINEEAIKRATSVYLVDRTIPMLPERLSNGLCSLRQDEDKLTYSVIFHMNNQGDVLSYKIARTVTRSNRRFTYEEAQEIIETGQGDYASEILQLNALAQILRTRRFAKGSIAFERTETRFEIDEKGKPISIYFKESKEANKLIEEFMLLANQTVATHIGKKKIDGKERTFVYRVHDVPNPDKLNNFAEFIKKFGYKLKTTGKNHEVSAALNHLLDTAEGKKEQNLIETLAVRSMAKAIYTTTNIGHYGLAFDYYTHFTSPIRRFPDMMVHRLLTTYLDGGKSVDPTQWEEWCDHSSDMEQLAANAERASIKYKQVEYMSERLGQVFDGVISGVTEWGIYVELNENKCEGMIPIRDLDDDYYVFDEKAYCITGRHYHRTYQLGDPIKIKVARADLTRKQLDFALVKE